MDPVLWDRLGAGAPGYLVFSHNGADIGLHGVAAAAQGAASVIDFAVLDGVQVSERRRGRRVLFVTRARLFPVSGDSGGGERDAIETFTLNLSASGALLRSRPQFAEHRHYDIELFFASDPSPIRCEAIQARDTDEGIGVAFDNVSEHDRERLIAVIGTRREALLHASASTPISRGRPMRARTASRTDGSAPDWRSGPVPRQPDRQLPVMQDMNDLEAVLGDFGMSFRSLFDAAPTGMAVVTLDGRWIGVNPALCAILGYDSEELLGLGFVDVTHPEDVDGGVQLLRRMVAGEIPRFTLEKRYIRKDGSVIWIRINSTLISDDGGEPQVAISQTEDITAQRLAADCARPTGL